MPAVSQPGCSADHPGLQAYCQPRANDHGSLQSFYPEPPPACHPHLLNSCSITRSDAEFMQAVPPHAFSFRLIYCCWLPLLLATAALFWFMWF